MKFLVKEPNQELFMGFVTKRSIVGVCKTVVRITQVQSKILNIVSPINFNICFVCSKEPSHLYGSFEYTQQMFW